MLAVAAIILSVGWTASTFGDWASRAHGVVELGPGVLRASGKWDANAAAEMSRAVRSTAATNVVVAQTAAMGKVADTFQSIATVYVSTKRDMLIMGSLRTAADTLLPPGMAELTTCAVMLFTKIMDKPELVQATKQAAGATASYASALVSALTNGAGHTAYALGWLAWTVGGIP